MVRMRKSVVQARRLVGKPAARELVPTMPGTSARWHMHDYPGPYCRWHYHPEFEIHLIQHGTGRSIVGDHIGRFTAGHLVLVGSEPAARLDQRCRRRRAHHQPGRRLPVPSAVDR